MISKHVDQEMQRCFPGTTSLDPTWVAWQVKVTAVRGWTLVSRVLEFRRVFDMMFSGTIEPAGHFITPRMKTFRRNLA